MNIDLGNIQATNMFTLDLRPIRFLLTCYLPAVRRVRWSVTTRFSGTPDPEARHELLPNSGTATRVGLLCLMPLRVC